MTLRFNFLHRAKSKGWYSEPESIGLLVTNKYKYQCTQITYQQRWSVCYAGHSGTWIRLIWIEVYLLHKFMSTSICEVFASMFKNNVESLKLSACLKVVIIKSPVLGVKKSLFTSWLQNYYRLIAKVWVTLCQQVLGSVVCVGIVVFSCVDFVE